MSDLSDVIRILPTMKSGGELLSALEVLPEYDAAMYTHKKMKTTRSLLWRF